MRQSNFLLSTFTGAGDITTGAGHLLLIAGVPDINYLTAKSRGLIGSQLETPQSSLVVCTAAFAVSTVYEFQITQYDPNVDATRVYDVSYPSTATDTAITAATAIIGIITNYVKNSGLNVTVTGTTIAVGSGITISGGAGNPFVSVTNVQNLTVSSAQLTFAGVALSTASPAVLAKGTTDGLATGMVVTLSGIVHAPLGNGNYRVTTTGAHTSTLTLIDGVTPLNGDGATADSVGVVTVAQASMGMYADIGKIVGAANPNPAVQGHTYSTVIFDQTAKGNPVLENPTQSESLILVWADEGAANYAAWAAQMVSELATLDIT